MPVSGLPNKVLIRGAVDAWRPALPRLRVRAGATVRFADAESHKREFVSEALAGQRPDAPRRRHDRFPVTVNVRYRVGQNPETHDSTLCEISAGLSVTFRISMRRVFCRGSAARHS